MCAVPDDEPVCSPDSEAVCLGVFSWLRKWGGGSIAELAPCLTLAVSVAPVGCIYRVWWPL